MKNIILFLLVTFLLTGCGTGSVTIQSFPKGATVSVVSADGAMSELGPVGRYKETKFFSHGDTVQLLIAKNNYTPQSVVLTKGIFSRTYKISVKLKKDGSNLNNTTESIEEVSKAIAASYRFLKEKDYDGVIRLLSPLATKFSGVSVINDFLGNAYYLKGNYQKAYRYYSEALQVNPNNFERRDIVNKIKGMIKQ